MSVTYNMADNIIKNNMAKKSATEEHARAGYAPVEHVPAEHRPAEHRPAEHRPAEHRPAEHRPAKHVHVAVTKEQEIEKSPRVYLGGLKVMTQLDKASTSLRPDKKIAGSAINKSATNKSDAPDRSLKQLALTFDDGPDPLHTPLLLDALKALDVPATFFVTLFAATRRPDLIKRMVKENHTVASHAWDHLHLANNTSLWERQITSSKKMLENLTDSSVEFFRPPYGETSSLMLEFCENLGLKTVLWSLEGSDWQERTPKAIHDSLTAHAQENDIILLHDGRKPFLKPAEVVSLLAPSLREKGFSFTAL